MLARVITTAVSTPILKRMGNKGLMAGTTRQRTCIVCRTSDAKNDLLRVVRTPEGAVEFDATGRKNGRGAYVCSVACLEKALASKRLDSALRTSLTDSDRERIASQLRNALADIAE